MMPSLPQQTPQERIAWLRSELERHNRLYYIQADPEISDSEYDALFRELEGLEHSHPELDSPNSPTKRVGGAPQEEFASIQHQTPMLSIDDIFEHSGSEEPDQELIDYYERTCQLAGASQLDVTVEPKIDGVAITLMYQNGQLAYAATRGDGHVGDDITANARTIRSIPLFLQSRFLPEVLEVRGEIFMPKEDFARLNAERDMNGEPAFANPRNAAAGTLKLLDSRQVAKRPLAFIAHGIGSYQGPRLSNADDFQRLLQECGLPCNTPVLKATSLDEVRQAVRQIDQLRHTLPFGTDGAVVKLYDFTLREQLGATARAPRWAAAYKFPPEQKATLLKAISIQVGRTGVLTPVAELSPIRLSGTTVSRATLHNQDEISRKDIRIGDTVIVEKAGEIIPAIIRIVPEKRPTDAQPYSIVKAVQGMCPACGAPISQQEGMVAWKCTNFTCPAQAVSRITHFCSRAALDIESIGTSAAEALVEARLAHSPLDLFDLSIDQLAGLNLGTIDEPRRFGEKNARKAWEALHTAAPNLPLDRWVTAFGIPQVGEVIAHSLAATHASLVQLSDSPYLRDLIRLDDLLNQLQLANPNTRANKKLIREAPDSEANIQQNFVSLLNTYTSTARPWLERGYIRELKNKVGKIPAYGSDIGVSAAREIINFFASQAGRRVFQKLDQLDIAPPSPTYRAYANEQNQGLLEGKSFVITGTLSQPRSYFEKLIAEHGGKVSSAISQASSYLLAGKGGGSKRAKAVQWGISIISEEDFMKMIHS